MYTLGTLYTHVRCFLMYHTSLCVIDDHTLNLVDTVPLHCCTDSSTRKSIEVYYLELCKSIKFIIMSVLVRRPVILLDSSSDSFLSKYHKNSNHTNYLKEGLIINFSLL